MYVSQIYIQRFRIFEELYLTLNSGLNVIVGENNSGKSALIDAIRVTLDTKSSEWTRITETDFHDDADNFHITLKFSGITPDHARRFVEHLTYEKGEEGDKQLALYITLTAHRTEAIRRGRRIIRSDWRSGINGNGPSVEREVREYLAATYLKPLRDAEAELSSGRGSRLAQILSSSKHFKRDGESFKTLLEGLIAASIEAKKNDGLQNNKSDIDKYIKELTFNTDRFELSIEMLGSKEFENLDTLEKERAFQDILHRLSLVLDESQPTQGLGYNNILFMATELILLEQESDEFPLLLIEEPEAHLHPQLQMKLLKFIRDTKSPALQTIMTTHSPNLASKAPLESIILLSNGEAFPLKKTDTLLDDEDYVFLEKFLDITKSNLFFARSVLIVEGDAENILLPTIAKLIGKPLEDYGVSIVNVGNTAYTRYAKIFLRRDSLIEAEAPSIPVKVACLRDLDLWPERSDKVKYPKFGFKELKKKNEIYWLPRENEEGKKIGTAPQDKRDDLKSFDVLHNEKTQSITEPENIRVFVSDEWTFEYCLIRSGLGKEIYQILKTKADCDYSELSDDDEIRAIQIYRLIESNHRKTELAYLLSQKLIDVYSSSSLTNQLYKKLPEYIKSALEYVTDSTHPSRRAAQSPKLQTSGE
ncbi:ATP-dependent nuclease [Idiomarina seosinensis]|uniref:ATP-dependent endonuclease n=1 Tax=Idiomarina seosinensis TaxID=281739 RepID=A0A432ZIZ6_9GAMM|nr:AAA family ATPase [Idiomarina seosinensis]RUO77883.1 ATP-dependent endonuclease [Idiomarina seosinensis]